MDAGVLQIVQIALTGGLLFKVISAAMEVGSMRTRLETLEKIVGMRTEYRHPRD